ncbi:MAG: hypothetical protein QOD75_3049 [Blastocatellia bacterium]|nr:hypothetical protein [Blastocatellia bacterium]
MKKEKSCVKLSQSKKGQNLQVFKAIRFQPLRLVIRHSSSLTQTWESTDCLLGVILVVERTLCQRKLASLQGRVPPVGLEPTTYRLAGNRS